MPRNAEKAPLPSKVDFPRVSPLDAAGHENEALRAEAFAAFSKNAVKKTSSAHISGPRPREALQHGQYADGRGWHELTRK